jgi:ketosteroid isomerase-like protein
MQRDVERVEELYTAFSQRNVQALLMLMADEVELVQSPELPWGGAYRGHEGVRQFLAKLAEQVDSRLEIESLIDAGEQVVAVGRAVGKTRATNLEFNIPFVHVWTLRDGQVTRFEPYIDNATMLAVLNL